MVAKKKVVLKRTKKVVKEKPVEPEVYEVAQASPVGHTCHHCGCPVAEGQTEVCSEHIRRG